MDKFFEEAFNEENAVEENSTEQVEQIETTEEQAVETPKQEEVKEEEKQEETLASDKVVVEGLGEFTIEELKEMKAGYMRQSDYTRKTQELAKARKELEALRNNADATPQTQQEIYAKQQALDPVESRIQELEQKLADKELDDEISRLKQQYPDFDEVKVLNEAYEKGITDLELVYKATREIPQVDVKTIEEQIKERILKELAENKEATSSIVSTSSAPVTQRQPELSPSELAMCEEFGLSPEEYYKYK